ncbi:M1 family metallopeptidase [Streptomyces sp. WMMC1477]|uniref:M1 family metallopeptidase n=1 Tax=Streptomyces sp. WMMC1477 TaxID=3015155 RepID=UPI0022B6055E|nr:M1 family metallopeptidase [Streptomyces sp. WMMC1477]MCZ7434049.1 M1 family metallopeptidase [Streptomyces sp. WMMC1477]
MTTARARSAPRPALAVAGAAVSLALLAAAPAPEPLGIGDRLFPALGNPGYDVLRYDITLRYTGDNTRPLEARTRIAARVTGEPLERLNLDFANGTVREARVDGAEVPWLAAAEDIVLSPERPLPEGKVVDIDIRHTSPTRGARPSGWIRTERDGLVMANQADAAHRVFPSNDHPSDKAGFTFRVTTPAGFTAVASGRRTARRADEATVTRTFRTARPMATELAQVAIGRSLVLRREGPDGLPLRDVIPVGHRAELEPWLRKTSGHLRWMRERVGDYPFATYGLLVAEADLGFALETQTLSLFSVDFFTDPRRPDWHREAVMIHELAHHWFGNSVSPRRWSDLWLNEGHATWYEWLYAAEHGGPSLEALAKRAYQASDAWRRDYGPPARIDVPEDDDKLGIFRPVVYEGGAVALYALRQEIGAEKFGELQRAWVSRHAHGVASTEDFVRLASEVAGEDLSAFLRDWLYGERTPAMPGHPDWRTKPRQG